MKDLNYWKNNCEEDYITTPISVLRYITELEKNNEAKQLILSGVSISLARAEKYARMQHFLGETGSDFIEFNDWKQD